MNKEAYLDFRAAQEAYLKANGWVWAVSGAGVKWTLDSCAKLPIWQSLDDAVARQVRKDELLFEGK